MKKSKKISVVIISADKEIIELAKENSNLVIRGILDPNLKGKMLGVPVLGNDNQWSRLAVKFPGLRAILALDPAGLKGKLAYHYGISSLITLISADAYVCKSATLGNGCLLQCGVKIMSSAKIGLGCKINVNVTVHHDCTVGDFCTLAPGSILLGTVKIESKVFVGAGAVILPRVRIGENAIIGAGAVVINDVTPNSVVAGVPARQIIKKS